MRPDRHWRDGGAGRSVNETIGHIMLVIEIY